MPISLAPQLALAGAPLPAMWLDALIEVRVEREFQVPGRCTLRFVDPGYALLASNTAHLGTLLKVSAPAPDSGVLIECEVTSVAAEQRDGEQPELVVVAHDKSHRLGRATKVTTYLEMEYSAVVTKVASAHGLAASVDSSRLKVEYLLQVDSDLGLITELARRVGFDWWVEGTTLNFKRPKAGGAGVELTMEEGLRSFSVRASGHHPDSVTVDGWDRHKQQAVTSTAPINGATVKASSALADLASKSGSAFGSAVLTSAGQAAGSQDEATQLSDAMRDRAASCAVTARGMADGSSRIKPGATVDVTAAGPLSGTYPVTRVEHVYRRSSGFVTRFVAGDRRPTSLVDTLSGGRPTAMPATQHPGLVVGQVTNINDPSKVGRVKVRYPGLSETDESAWARLVAIGGGKDRGNVFIPEVGDEVLVGFEAGDPRQPVVLGGLFGDRSTIPAWNVEGGKVSARGLTSRLGHVVTLADGTDPATQHVLIQLAGKQHTLMLGKDKVDLEVPAGTPVNIKAGTTSIVFGADGSIKMEGMSISIKAQTTLSLEGVQVSVKGSAQLALEGTAQASLKGAAVQVNGSGMVAVQGGIVQIN